MNRKTHEKANKIRGIESNVFEEIEKLVFEAQTLENKGAIGRKDLSEEEK